MSLLIYSNCHIRFEPNDSADGDEYETSDRSLIQIRASDDGTYKLEALDLNNKKQEIFNIPITLETKYNCGSNQDEPDRIQNSNGTYFISLNIETRDGFHNVFSSIQEILRPSPPTENVKNFPKEQKRTFTSDSLYRDATDILVEVHNLNHCIHKGKLDEAAQIASELAQKDVRLQVKNSDNYKREESFQIRVQFDGNEYGVDQTGAQIPVQVYPSTTIRELRAIFERSYHYLPPNQYFFVNGKLTNDNDTMKELKVGPKSLFILFLVTYPRKFQKQGPWKCSLCTMTNPEENLKCNICSASRKE